MKSYNLTKVNVSVVDGHKEMRHLLRSVIKALGVEHIDISGDTEEFTHLNSEVKPDVIFADWSPKLDGVKLVKEIRLDKSVHDRFIPIVMVSAFTDLPRVCAARDAGVTEFLAKPISAELIYRRICSLVENPRDYVQSHSFFGPDRRRRNIELSRTDRRHLASRPSGQESSRSHARRAI